MDSWHMLLGAWGALGWIIAIILFIFAWRMLESGRIAPQFVGVEQEEPIDPELSAKRSEAGKLGAQAKLQNMAERTQAYDEAKAVLLNPTIPKKEKIDQLKALILKYPRVAEAQAVKLDKELGVSKSMGITRQELLGMVGQWLVEAGEKPAGAGSGDGLDSMLSGGSQGWGW